MSRCYALTLLCLAGATLPLTGSVPVLAKQVQLDVALAHPTMYAGEGGSRENHLRIALTGFDLPDDKPRMPVNVAIVIDKSGSMQGEKIEQARRAAMQAVDRLRASDIVSVVTYDSSVEVVMPATKATDREAIKRRIREIQASGNTALFAGVSKGAAEVRKFLDDKRVNRVVLLSDGLANVGPSSPAELEQLGTTLLREGISVSTMGLGLGYNEDLMSRLALASSGNHVFIEDAENLVKVFQNEFDDVLSVVAQRIKIQVKLAEGIRAVKLLNDSAEISGQLVSIDLGQLYSQQERYFVLEVEVPLGESGGSRPVAKVSVEYFNMATETVDKLSSSVQVKFSHTREVADKDVDPDILAACVIQIANQRNREATLLRDAGKIEDARQLLLSNAAYLTNEYQRLGRDDLRQRGQLNKTQAAQLDAPNWAGNRKSMVEAQVSDAIQQSYRGTGEKAD
ncbi:MAG: VWA domain-containing protein [Planctomycetales bacterium]|nr:VWA domain-containing protein [Planctomycetales bacterium]